MTTEVMPKAIVAHRANASTRKIATLRTGRSHGLKFFLGDLDFLAVRVSDEVVHDAALGLHGAGDLFPSRLIDVVQHAKGDAVLELQLVPPACLLDFVGTTEVNYEVSYLENVAAFVGLRPIDEVAVEFFRTVAFNAACDAVHNV